MIGTVGCWLTVPLYGNIKSGMKKKTSVVYFFYSIFNFEFTYLGSDKKFRKNVPIWFCSCNHCSFLNKLF